MASCLTIQYYHNIKIMIHSFDYVVISIHCIYFCCIPLSLLFLLGSVGFSLGCLPFSHSPKTLMWYRMETPIWPLVWVHMVVCLFVRGPAIKWRQVKDDPCLRLKLAGIGYSSWAQERQFWQKTSLPIVGMLYRQPLGNATHQENTYQDLVMKLSACIFFYHTITFFTLTCESCPLTPPGPHISLSTHLT